ncbi:hypothetical protein VOLCADRAFT_94804 [Volvox carteri f. nagariensis]|uniref:Uncharacterized protein n=1 Tax=Volvox carteri f. nagariensis TaxID=3068 RepID=D8U5T5_VOLCA|nr:uncharacterized protein VOLCADRAFT_94804 [Volvox carteri f. nagariensis]EFJ45056.1 hypothetical protein VOLCADRAFT_94804 [Volvox carteri f. nagariensis]|eukprot:XP_002954027.1 hypothetical protein VOLCADRAFT_94804 [Volvox carteri f. nagariensis]
MRHAVLMLLQAIALLLLARTTVAAKYNLTGTVKAVLVASNEPPGVMCGVPGICKPATVTIPARTLWYWCGFQTTHRTIYEVTTNNKNITISTVYMTRQTVLEECALSPDADITYAGENCTPIPESSCSSKATCSVRLFGLVFPDDSCLIMINNKNSAINATVQINNFFDRPRYFGTVFVLFFAVVGGLAVVSNVAWQFYNIIIAPVNRHHEPVKVKREDPIKKDLESDSSGPSSGSAGGGGAAAARPGWYQNATVFFPKILAKLRPTQQSNGHKA